MSQTLLTTTSITLHISVASLWRPTTEESHETLFTFTITSTCKSGCNTM